MKEASLYFRDGVSDKEYHAKVEKQGSGFIVTFAYGRRGSALVTGEKTQAPVSQLEAEKSFDKLVREKIAKGYVETTGVSVASKKINVTSNAGGFSGLLPQLLNPVEEAECERILESDLYGLQEKLDGKRIMVTVNGIGAINGSGNVNASNRKGIFVSIPQVLEMELARWSDCVLDGELIGETYYVFDCLRARGEELRDSSYRQRYASLDMVQYPVAGGNVVVVPLYIGKRKREMLKEFQEARKEGVVFKLLSASHSVGRPNKGGAQLKYKFVEMCSAVVEKVNAQRSVALSIEGKKVGNVTILPNFPVPKKGDVVEVRYLYYNKGGSLYQPVYLGVRDDLEPNDCKLSQLKEKAEVEEEV